MMTPHKKIMDTWDVECCPRCEALESVEILREDNAFQVQCSSANGGCGLETPKFCGPFTTEQDAYDRWNNQTWRARMRVEAWISKSPEGPAPEQWTCATHHIVDQCTLLHLEASGYPRLTERLLGDLRALYDTAGPKFCGDVLPRLREIVSVGVPF